MKKLLCYLLLLSFLVLVIPTSQALSRTFQVEPWGFFAGRINLQSEMQTAPLRSVLVDGAVNWNNDLGKASYLAVGGGLRQYTVESFKGPWFGGKVQFINMEDKKSLRASLLGGFKWVLTGGFTQELFVGARVDQPLSQENALTQVNSLVGYTIGYSY